MTNALARLETLLAHPAPGLVFGPHKRAMLARRAHASRHERGGVMSSAERQELDRLVGGRPELADLRELYECFDGARLFSLKCPRCDDPHWGLSLLPVSEWDAATGRWRAGGECASFMEECTLYTRGEWRVIAATANEGMSLVQFFSGERDGESLAGRIFCIGLDGVLGFEEEVAGSLSAMMDEMVRDPAAFFGRLGFCWSVESDHGCFGDPVESYVADVRGHPDAAPWPVVRPA